MTAFDPFYAWAAIVALALCTVLSRSSFLLLGDYIPLPDSVRRALRYAPGAALAAIVVPDLLPWVAGEGPRFDLRPLAALVSVWVMYRTRNTAAMIAAAMVALWVLRALFG